MRILMIDVGGTNVKLMASGPEGYRKFPSGRTLTAAKMVKGVLKATEDWEYEAISLGFPGLVREGCIVRNPLNLAGGWMDFDFDKAFQRPGESLTTRRCRHWRPMIRGDWFSSASARASVRP